MVRRIATFAATWALEQVAGFGGALLLLWESLIWLVRPPFRWRLIFQQMEFIGAGTTNRGVTS